MEERDLRSSCRPGKYGKTAHAARCGDGRAVHLLGMLSHSSRVCSGTDVDHKINEITAFVPLLERTACPLTVAVVTADALHAGWARPLVA